MKIEEALRLVNSTPANRLQVSREQDGVRVMARYPEVNIGLIGASSSGKSHLLSTWYELRNVSVGGNALSISSVDRDKDPIKLAYDRLLAREPIKTTKKPEAFALCLRRGLDLHPLVNIRFFDIPGQDLHEPQGDGGGPSKQDRHRTRSLVADADIILLAAHVDEATSIGFGRDSRSLNRMLDEVHLAWEGKAGKRVLAVLFTQVDRYAQTPTEVERYLELSGPQAAREAVQARLKGSSVLYNFFAVSAFGLGCADQDATDKDLWVLRAGAAEPRPYGTSYSFLWALSQHIRCHGHQMKLGLSPKEILVELNQIMEGYAQMNLVTTFVPAR